MCIFSKFTTNEFCTAKHVAPLVVSTKFEITIVILE